VGKGYRSKSFSILKQGVEKKPEQVLELGFGTRPADKGTRLINQDGSFNVRRVNEKRQWLADAYHTVIALSWSKFFSILFVVFIAENLLFSVIYYLIGTEHLAGVIGETPFEKFSEVFFFSSQTLTTLGYGRISPIGFWSSAVAAIESMVGLLAFALSTSLLWGRFSKPSARLIYSKNALIAPYRDGKGLMVRLVNARKNHLIELEASMIIARNVERDGKMQRSFKNLPLELSKVNNLALSWTLVHAIDENSPVWGEVCDVITDECEILVNLKAFDESYSQTVYSRTSYKSTEVIENAKFISMMSSGDDGKTVLDISKLSDFEKL
jgi:inward rectifier potassium channel